MFVSILAAVILALLLAAIFKVKFFGMILAEYIKPIWLFVLISVAVVFWQYLVGLTLDRQTLWLRLSQIVWEIMVGASVYKMLKRPDFSYGNLFVLGVLYSLIIHGLKVSIRYFFYAKDLWYVADRFLYGSFLVMLIVVGAGSLALFFKKKGILF